MERVIVGCRQADIDAWNADDYIRGPMSRGRSLRDVTWSGLMCLPDLAPWRLNGSMMLRQGHEQRGKGQAMVAGWGPPRPEVLRVLYVTASSRGDLRVDEEIRRVKAAVRAAVHRDGVHIEHQPAATLEDLLDGLSRVEPHVVSFSGHAAEDLVVFDTGSDVRGAGHRVPAGVFAQALGAVDTPPRLVVLNACRSQAQLEELVRVVPIAVGMAGSIGDPAAIAFAERFYAALTDGQSVRSAYRLAKVQLAGVDRTVTDADLPVLEHAPGIDPGGIRLVVPPPQPDRAQG